MTVDLTKLGLGKNEEKVYLALLKLKTASIKDIVTSSGTYRRTVYDALDGLIDKGLVSYLQMNKKRYFKAKSPDKLASMLKDKEDYLKSIMPSLMTMQPENPKMPQVEVFVGKKAMRNVLEEQIKSKEIFGIGVGGFGFNTFKYAMPLLVKRGGQSVGKAKLLAHEEARELYQGIMKELHSDLFEVRYLPKSAFAPVSIMIWQEKISMSVYQDPPFVIVIENKELYHTYKSYFNILWESAEKFKEKHSGR